MLCNLGKHNTTYTIKIQTLSAKSLHERILAKVHAQFELQTPQLQGDGQYSLFGADVTATIPTATVLEVDNTNRRVRLTSVGQAFGNRRGAQFAIYPLGSKSFSDPFKRQAIVTITEIGATDSWAALTSVLGAAPIEQGSPAVLLDQGSLKLLQKIALAHRTDLPAGIDQTTIFATIDKAMSGSPWVVLKAATESDTIEYQVATNEKRQFEIWDPAGQPVANLRPPIGVDNPNGAQIVVNRLTHLAKYNAVKQLENHDPESPLAGKLLIELVGYQEDYTPGEKPDPHPFEAPGNTAMLAAGQWIFLRIRNNANRALNVTVLDLQPDWGIKKILPSGEGDWFVQLEPGRDQLLTLKASLPPGYDRGRDVLKVFAAVGAANFARLELPALDLPPSRGVAKIASATVGQPNALESLMDAISGNSPPAIATRTLTSGAYPSTEWTTSLIEVDIQH
jgi:hypothetical protein